MRKKNAHILPNRYEKKENMENKKMTYSKLMKET